MTVSPSSYGRYDYMYLGRELPAFNGTMIADALLDTGA